MSTNISAIFDTHTQAEDAIAALRALGIPDSHLSFVSRHPEYNSFGDRVANEDVSDGATVGLVGGVLFGLAAIALPGVVPVLVAGGLISALGLGAATMATGAIAGGTMGALAGGLVQVGYDEFEANFYSDELAKGHVFVSINADEHIHTAHSLLRDVLVRHGGRSPHAVAPV